MKSMLAKAKPSTAGVEAQTLDGEVTPKVAQAVVNVGEFAGYTWYAFNPFIARSLALPSTLCPFKPCSS